MNDKNHFTENVVAFIDVLGFKSLIDRAIASNDPSLVIKHIKSSISDTFKSIKKIKSESISIKMFSDHIMISTNTSAVNIFFLIRIAAKIQFTLFMNNIWVRGAIAIGKHYEDATMVFSKAFLKALNLEEKYAIYPRILIDREIFDNFPKKDMEPFKLYYFKDNDGFYVVDYLGSILLLLEKEKDTSVLLDSLRRHKNHIEGHRTEILSNSDIGKKFLWAANYHNTKVLSSSLKSDVIEELKIYDLPNSY